MFLSLCGFEFHKIANRNAYKFLIFNIIMKTKQIIKEKKKDDEPEALFIPAGVLTGMGLGFLYGNLVAGLFIGLGIGFIIFAIISVLKKK
jgi:hypothetical protein